MSDSDGGCPHLAKNDHRCAHRFRLPQLEALFEVCCDRFHSCSTYHHLTLEQEASGAGSLGPLQSNPAPIRLTINGFTEDIRATGS